MRTTSSSLPIRRAELDPEDEKEYQKEMAEKFKPLMTWMKEQAGGTVRDGNEILSLLSDMCSLFLIIVVISNRLVTSPVAIVADMFGYTANVQKLMSE